MHTFKHAASLSAIAACALLAGCTHLKGIVVDPSNHPVTDAYFTVGRPTGVGVSATYRCDSFGRFDFSIFPTDEDFIFLWDGRGDPETDVQHVYKTEMNTDMRVIFHPAMPGPGN